ncbi:unnamed protein product [Gordionus sp. m RMFG-2023]|uniref:frizzled-5-like n=1 Tax=Gordionus sp. m RMFG-2023 TaxID=3053472 RepID=UPI0030E25866
MKAHILFIFNISSIPAYILYLTIALLSFKSYENHDILNPRINFAEEVQFVANRFIKKDSSNIINNYDSFSGINFVPVRNKESKKVQENADEMVDINPKCQVLTIPMCKNLGYNMTLFPNPFNHETQNEAGMEVHQFWPLVEIQCSRDLKFFLCSMYAPICMEDYHKPISVCRSVCERSKAGCIPLMRKYGFEWPERMNCEKLPNFNTGEEFCLDLNRLDQEDVQSPITGHSYGEDITLSDHTSSFKDKTTLNKKVFEPNLEINLDDYYGNVDRNKLLNFDYKHQKSNFLDNIDNEDCHNCRCPHPLISLNSDSDVSNLINVNYNATYIIHDGEIGGVNRCYHSCKGSIYFNDQERTTAYFWIGIWSFVCFTACTFTLLTFFLDKSRFVYPQRPIIYISLCYLFISFGYLLRFICGENNVACFQNILRSPSSPIVQLSTINGFDSHSKHSIKNLLNSNDHNYIICYIEFFLIYYFSMANYIWWIILALTWLLSARFEWGDKALSNISFYFQCIAWILPAFQIFVSFLTKSIDGDPLYGICFIGHTNSNNLKLFIIYPLAFYLVIGSLFIAIGFSSMLKIKYSYSEWKETNKFNILIWRIGIYSISYIIPTITVLICYIYENMNKEAWDRSHTSCPTGCRGIEIPSKLLPNINLTYKMNLLYESHSKFSQNKTVNLHKINIDKLYPLFWVFSVKYFMSLAVGTFTAGIWIFSRKTLATWNQFFSSIKFSMNGLHKLPKISDTMTDVKPIKNLINCGQHNLSLSMQADDTFYLNNSNGNSGNCNLPLLISKSSSENVHSPIHSNITNKVLKTKYEQLPYAATNIKGTYLFRTSKLDFSSSPSESLQTKSTTLNITLDSSRLNTCSIKSPSNHIPHII